MQIDRMASMNRKAQFGLVAVGMLAASVSGCATAAAPSAGSVAGVVLTSGPKCKACLRADAAKLLFQTTTARTALIVGTRSNGAFHGTLKAGRYLLREFDAHGQCRPEMTVRIVTGHTTRLRLICTDALNESQLDRWSLPVSGGAIGKALGPHRGRQSELRRPDR